MEMIAMGAKVFHLPFHERIGRLNGVMAIDQERGFPWHWRAFGPHHRVSRSFKDLHHRAAQGC